MLPVELLLSFFLAAVLLALAPGPDNLFVLAQAALHGRRAGLLVTLGLCTGLLGHTLAVTAGVAAVLQATPLAFTALRLCGAGYLLWLAWQAWRAASPTAADVPRLPSGRLYRRGIVMNLSNPKVTLFFLAFLPQFVRPAFGPVSGQMLLLGVLFMLATLLVFGALALLAGTLGPLLQRAPHVQRWLNRGAGVVFAVLALHLVVAGGR